MLRGIAVDWYLLFYFGMIYNQLVRFNTCYIVYFLMFDNLSVILLVSYRYTLSYRVIYVCTVAD